MRNIRGTAFRTISIIDVFTIGTDFTGGTERQLAACWTGQQHRAALATVHWFFFLWFFHRAKAPVLPIAESFSTLLFFFRAVPPIFPILTNTSRSSLESFMRGSPGSFFRRGNLTGVKSPILGKPIFITSPLQSSRMPA